MVLAALLIDGPYRSFNNDANDHVYYHYPYDATHFSQLLIQPPSPSGAPMRR